MRIGFLGHESWIVNLGKTNILIDPILEESFGTSNYLQFYIFPFRSIDLVHMPKITSIVITTEHLQHFHIKTYQRLLKLYKISELPHIYVAPLIPECAVEILQELGFYVYRCADSEVFQISSIKCIFYTAKNKTLFWDNRVASLYVFSDEPEGGTFFQSDTLPADRFFEDIKTKKFPAPRALVLTNNFSKGRDHPIGLDNLFPVEDERYGNLAGLRLIDGIISNGTKKLPGVKKLILAGNGYLDNFGQITHPWNNEELAKISSQLSLSSQTLSLAPGQEFDFMGDIANLNWINPISSIPILKKDLISDFKILSIFPPLHDFEKKDSFDLIESHLMDLSRSWLITSYGQVFLKEIQHLGKWLKAERLCLQLIDSNSNSRQFVLNLSKGKFIESTYDGIDAMKKFPYGIAVNLQDYVALLLGKIQIWELISVSAKQWYVCDLYESPLAFLLEYFNEQVQPDLALKSYLYSLIN